MPGLARNEPGYPPEWPLVAWIVKAQAGWACEHCGRALPPGAGARGRVLGVHHLDGDVHNLMSWNLVALCIRCHGWADRQRLSVDDVDQAQQLSLVDDSDPLPSWLLERRQDRRRFLRLDDEALRATERPATASGRLRARTTGSAAPSGPPPRLCACGCGQPVLSSDRRRRYVDHAHQQRAYLERRADQVSLLTVLGAEEAQPP